MKHRLFSVIIPVGTAMLASCYPYPQDPRMDRPVPNRSVTDPQQQNIQEQRDRMREEAERKKERDEQEARRDTPTRETPPPTTEPTRRTEYPFATPVPGKEGFVFSPYNNKIVDVRSIASGTLVEDPDPTYSPSDKKYFRVP